MPKRERDEAVAELSATIFSAMLEEILMDVVQQSHKEIARARAVCDICHTRCIASNRYAPHLSSCMGIGNRRGAARNATAKSKLGSEFGKSASPRLASEAAHLSDDGGKPLPPAKGKSKAKPKKTASEDVILNSNGKRVSTPASRVKLDPDSPLSSANVSFVVLVLGYVLNVPQLLPPTSTASRVPSRLRESSVASSFQRDRRSSSPDSPRSSPARSISTQASTAIRSPAISNATIKTKQTNGKGRGAPPPPRLPSPPRPPPPVPIIRMPDTDYLVDVEGEETGSSTDTDSD
ncbi:hypothetical protein FKP32DRAFT_1589340 [Trametes sanguinea]|nr:hypothetical protein FKP32DRAFT_1589340 [Trametes sanguinea]